MTRDLPEPGPPSPLEPRRELADLPARQLKELAESLLDAFEQRDRWRPPGAPGDPRSDDEVYLQVLDEHGVPCPHPPHRVAFAGSSDRDDLEAEGRVCGICGNAVR